MNRRQRRIDNSRKGQIPQAQATLQQAIALHRAGQFAQAKSLYEVVIKIHPDHFDALHLSGVLAGQVKNYQKAVELLDKAIRVNPEHAGVYSSRGIILHELKAWNGALASYDQAIALKPDYAEAHFNRGIVLRELNAWDAALASYDRAIALKPDYAEAFYNRGNVLKEQKAWDAALASYDRAIALKPDYPEAHANRGMILQEQRQWDASLVSFDRAIALNPSYAEAYANRGIVLRKRGRPEAALASYDQAIALKPDYAEAYSSRGVILHELKAWDAALTSHNRAIALRPDYAEGHYNKSFTLLLSGDFAHGLEAYEWRWKTDGYPKRQFSQPLWLGSESLAGKTILLYPEQGLGDTLQFCRYASMVADLGARVMLLAPATLVNILTGLPGVTELIAEGSIMPDFDYHCPLLSLPLAFRTHLQNIPATGKYLAGIPAKVEQWQANLGDKTKPRIGLVWSGSPVHKNDHNRSIPLADLVKQLPSGLQYVSLQKETNAADRQTLVSHPELLHFGDALKDFSDTAALCELMDVVLSVDTSVAHLSGAMGKPTWILLPFVPDWRWLLDREDSPWYPTVRLFRQSKMGDWENVLAQIKAQLISRVLKE